MKISRKKFLYSLFVLLGLVGLYAFWFERLFLQWNHFDISKGLNKKIKLIQLSDIHLQKMGNHHRLIAERINKEKPDLLLFTGDAIDAWENMAELDKFLGLLEPNIQKIAITGNWEYWGNVDLKELKTLYATHNCQLLINESRQFLFKGRTISVTGIDDMIGGHADFLLAKQEITPSDLNLVLSHCPAHRDIIQQENGDDLKIDLVLSGHTHGGQINFFGLVPFKPHGSGNYLSGWYRENGPPLYVSKGIGTSLIPLRFGARAEVAVFEV